MPYNKVQDRCYPCSVKNQVIDAPHANLYAFCELFIISSSSTIGYRTDEDSQERYIHVVSSHGFSPLDVNQEIFDNEDGNYPQIIQKID